MFIGGEGQIVESRIDEVIVTIGVLRSSNVLLGNDAELVPLNVGEYDDRPATGCPHLITECVLLSGASTKACGIVQFDLESR